MKPLIIVMLCVQAGIFLAAAYSVMFRKHSAGRRRPLWSSLAITLVIVASTSWQIADKRAGTAGADVLQFGAALLLGMALMAIFMLIRQRRGLDGGEPPRAG
jgi:drug/metabolite transporter (DMT)-like permease